VGHGRQRRTVDVAARQLDASTRGPQPLGDRHEEPAVAARRIEHPDRPTGGGQPIHDVVDHDLHQLARRVPGAQRLAIGGRGHDVDVGGGHRASVGGTSRSVPDRYLTFSRQEWAPLRASIPLTLSEADLESLRGINDRIDLDEVAEIYLPLSRLLNLYVSAVQDLQQVSSTFLGSVAPKVPYVIGIAGS